MPENNNNTWAERQFVPNSDDNTLRFVRNIIRAYGEMGLLSQRDVDASNEMTDVDALNQIVSKVPEMTILQRQEFCGRFVGMESNVFNGATPAIKADAYRYFSAHANEDEKMLARKQELAEHIDRLSEDFANSGGMVVDNGNFPLVDTTNIADVYAGFSDMLNARMQDLDKERDAAKINQMNDNLKHLDSVVVDYDDMWGISELKPEDAPKMERRWDDLNDSVNRAELTDKTKAALSKYHFLDKEDKVIPQFVDDKGNSFEDWQPGRQIIKDGRLASVIEFARHDLVKKHVAEFDKEIDDQAIQDELNEEALIKLYEMDTADKIVQGAIAHPEQFTDPKNREAFIAELSERGGYMSDDGYTAAVDAQTNATAGWAARTKAKLGGAASKVGGFFGKVFRPLQRVDRMKDVRMHKKAVSKREKRIEFFTRMLKGFASAFLTSALITTIATAAAALAGVSLAASLAIIGTVTAIGMGWLQVQRWRKAQQKEGRPTDLKAFLADKRLLTSLGTSAIAICAMCFGAAGLSSAAMTLGYGALAMGGAKNTLETFRDARNANMSTAESLAWALANAGAVIAGGFAGRAVANNAIDAFNRSHPENETFQNKETRTETVDNRHEETYQKYTDEALDNAKSIAERWYQDNPDMLQQRVAAIEQYNANHGTNIDPYRAIMINADAGGHTFDNMMLHQQGAPDIASGGNHRVMTDAWGKHYGFSHEDLAAARNVFAPDGSVNDAGMEVIARLDPHVSTTNTIGTMAGRPVFTDGYFNSNDPEGWTTYTGGESPFETVTHTVGNVDTVTHTDYSRAIGDGMGMFGVYNRKPKEGMRDVLRDRVGAFADRLRVHKPEPEDDPKILPPHEEEDPKILPPHEEEDPKILPPHEEEDPKILPPHEEEDPKILPPHEEENPKILPPHEEEQKVLPPHEDDRPELQYAITRAQAKKWDDLLLNLKRVRDKRQKPGLKQSEAEDLKRKEKDIAQDLRQLYNDLGQPDMLTLDHARREAYRRYDLKQAIEELERHEMYKPKGGYAGARMPEWEKKRAELIKKIDELGGPDSLDESNLYYPTPVDGVQAKKKKQRREEAKRVGQVDIVTEDEELGDVEEVDYELVDSQRPEHQEPKESMEPKPQEPVQKEQPVEQNEPKQEETVQTQERPTQPEQKSPMSDVVARASERAGTVDGNREYFLPESLKNLAKNADVLSEPLMNMRGVPVKMVDMSGTGNPITQTHDRAIVVVEISGIRVPFYLNSGKDAGTQGIAGHWRPVYGMGYDGTLYTGFDTPDDAFVGNLHQLDVVARMLDERIGDIRNYREIQETKEYQQAGNAGFVGGADCLPNTDTEQVCEDLLEVTDDKNNALYGSYSVQDAPRFVRADKSVLGNALGGLKTPEFQKAHGNIARALQKVRERSQRLLGGRLLGRKPNTNERK